VQQANDSRNDSATLFRHLLFGVASISICCSLLSQQALGPLVLPANDSAYGLAGSNCIPLFPQAPDSGWGND